MTFDEALEIKERYGDISIHEGKEWYVRVVPKVIDDMRKYVADFSERDISDVEAKAYSTDGEFMPYRFIKDSYDRRRINYNRGNV